jgi:hypothetical protein
MSQREYAEDTVFWSLKSAKQFSARRRTIMLFLANATSGAASSYTWIDNTPEVWADVLAVLEGQKPEKIAVNVDAEISFSSGMHAGEFEMLRKELGHWSEKLVNEPMIAVEFIATQPKDRLKRYKNMQEMVWALVTEAFSEKVITPGKTTTEV